MRYPASEKVEIIRLVEQSHLSVRCTLEQIGVSRATFYRWYDRYQTGGPEALEDRPSQPSRVWNRIPDDTRQQILALALGYCNLTSGNSFGGGVVRPCQGRPRQGRSILVFHGVAKPAVEIVEWTGSRIRRSRLSWNI